MKKFDVVVLGSGPAGIEVCTFLSQFNKKICLIEKNTDAFGGVCVNKGCMPTKHLVKVAEVIESGKKALTDNFLYFKILRENHLAT